VICSTFPDFLAEVGFLARYNIVNTRKPPS
jgi:hypothetical protein